MIMSTSIRFLLTLILFLAAGVAAQKNWPNVTIAYVDDHSFVPHRIAVDKGFYETLRLNVQLIAYPNKEELLEAANSSEWDFATADVFANILGGQQDLVSVGIAVDLSRSIGLMGNPTAVDNFPPKEASWPAICVENNTLSDYVSQKCLQSLGFYGNDMVVIYDNATNCINELTPGFYAVPWVDMGRLDSPYNYEYLDLVEDSAMLCNAHDVSAPLTAGHMVRKDFGDKNVGPVAKILSGWMRAVEFMKNESNYDEVLRYATQAYTIHAYQNGVPFPPAYVKQELELLHYPDYEEQLTLMNRTGSSVSTATTWGNDLIDHHQLLNWTDELVGLDFDIVTDEISTYDLWTNEVAFFMKSVGFFGDDYVRPTSFIDTRFIERVQKQDALRMWATGYGLYDGGEEQEDSSGGLSITISKAEEEPEEDGELPNPALCAYTGDC